MKNQIDLKKLTKNEYAGALLYAYLLSFVKGLTYSFGLSLALHYLFNATVPFYFLFFTAWILPDIISMANREVDELKLQKFYGLSSKTLLYKQVEFLSSDDKEEK